MINDETFTKFYRADNGADGLPDAYKISTAKGLLIVLILSALLFCWWNSLAFGKTSESFSKHDKNLNHFRSNRNLADYLLGMKLLLEPTVSPCQDKEISILVTVATSPFHVEQRHAIRQTWATRLPTLFIVGLSEPSEINDLEDKQYDDLIVYDFQDHYQNLTLKTALMIKWVSEKCSSVHFLLKTDDDVLLNPWQLETIVINNPDADLIGYKNENARLYRQEDSKWYLPRWLYADDVVPEYLSGNAYMMNGRHLRRILEAAYEVPLINMEDIYFTYLVARRKLGLMLTHEDRLYGFKPLLPLANSYWKLASVHSLTPSDILKRWAQLVYINKSQEHKAP